MKVNIRNIVKNLTLSALVTTSLAACSCGNKIAQTDMPGEVMSNSAGLEMVTGKVLGIELVDWNGHKIKVSAYYDYCPNCNYHRLYE